MFSRVLFAIFLIFWSLPSPAGLVYSCDKTCIDEICVAQWNVNNNIDKGEEWIFQHIHECVSFINYMRDQEVKADMEK